MGQLLAGTRTGARGVLVSGSVLAAATLGFGCGGNTAQDDAERAAGSGGRSTGAAAGTGATASSEGGGAAVGGSAPAQSGGALPMTGGSGAAAGGPPGEFCAGEARVFFADRTLSPPVTSAPLEMMRSCCIDYGIRLHTAPELGMDVMADVGLQVGDFEPGEYALGDSGFPVSAGVRPSTDPASFPSGNVTGTVAVFGTPQTDELLEVGVCLEVDDPASPLFGARIHVPGVPIGLPSAWNDYFEIYLLADPALTAEDALALPLDSLELADEPWLDLRGVEFVEQATSWVELNRTWTSSNRLRDELGQVSVFGLPFVVESQGVRLYLGAFTTLVSSYLPPCPAITVESIAENGFTIEPPSSGSDPRSDPRLLDALSQANRLAP